MFQELNIIIPKSKNNIRLFSLVVFVAFISGTFLVHKAYGAVTEGCGFFDLSLECDLSGWMKFFMGDIAIAAGLALFLHFLAHRTQNRIETIIDSEEALRHRRKDYAILQFKTLWNSVLFTLGSINKQIINFNESLYAERNDPKKEYLRVIRLSEIRAEEAKMGRILLSIRNTLIASNDVLEPELTDQISGTITYIVETTRREHKDGSIDFPKYQVCKTKVKYLMQKLSTYDFDMHSFVTRNFDKEKVQNRNISQIRNLVSRRVTT